MHIILAIAGIATAAYIWIIRARNAAEISTELLDVANDVRAAARRFGFRRRNNQHPVEGIDDPNLAIGGLAMAFLELDDLPTAEARAQTDLALRKHLRIDAETAREIEVLGRWLVEQCQGAANAVPRLAKKLHALDGAASFDTMMSVLKDIVAAGDGKPSQRQSEALADIARIFRLK